MGNLLLTVVFDAIRWLWYNFTYKGASYYVGKISSAFLPRLVRVVRGRIRNLGEE